MLRYGKLPLVTVKAFTHEFASLDAPASVRSSHGLELLADMYAQEEDAGSRDKAAQAWDLLAFTFDPIRSNYWHYRKSQLEACPPAS